MVEGLGTIELWLTVTALKPGSIISLLATKNTKESLAAH